MIPRIAAYVVASWLIAAHFLRFGDLALMAACVGAPLLFLARRRWALLVLQWLAYAAGVVWLVTAWQIITERLAFGLPWQRSAVILLAVAAVTMLAGWWLRSAPPSGVRTPAKSSRPAANAA